jgi:hydrogenase-4 component F
MASAPRLHPEVIQLAFVFILIGYGTKAGLAPMHTWLPDAHSEAPAASSAMMSGVLLAVALYAIVRWEAVVNAAVGTRFTDDLFVAMGLLSLTNRSAVIQRNYKRMLAYSVRCRPDLRGTGPGSRVCRVLHLLNHAIAK